MGRDPRSGLSVAWAYRIKETAQGTPQTGTPMRLAFSADSRLALEYKRSDDRDGLTGSEGPAAIYAQARSSKGKLAMDMAMADFLAFVFGFFYGQSTPTDRGTVTKEHAATPLSDSLHPTFTAVQRLGNAVYYELFPGMAIDSFEVQIPEDGWLKASCELKGLGKSTVDFVRATGNLATGTTLQLPAYTQANEDASDGSSRFDGGAAASTIAGATSADKIANIHQLLVRKVSDGIWYPCTPTACSMQIYTTVTFTPHPSLTGLGTSDEYKIVYTSAQPDWNTVPAANQESPLLRAHASILVGAYYDGTAFTGGFPLNVALNDLTIKGANSLEVIYQPGGRKIFADRIERTQRILTISLSSRLREAVLTAMADANDTLSLQIDVQGAPIESTYNYGFRMMIPSLGILTHDVEDKGKFLARKGDLVALEDPSYGIGKVLTWNKQANYA